MYATLHHSKVETRPGFTFSIKVQRNLTLPVIVEVVGALSWNDGSGFAIFIQKIGSYDIKTIAYLLWNWVVCLYLCYFFSEIGSLREVIEEAQLSGLPLHPILSNR